MTIGIACADGEAGGKARLSASCTAYRAALFPDEKKAARSSRLFFSADKGDYFVLSAALALPPFLPFLGAAGVISKARDSTPSLSFM